jgi:hypothetical protein
MPDDDAITVVPLGFVGGGRGDAFDDDWGAVDAVIVLDPRRGGGAAPPPGAPQ